MDLNLMKSKKKKKKKKKKKNIYIYIYIYIYYDKCYYNRIGYKMNKDSIGIDRKECGE